MVALKKAVEFEEGPNYEHILAEYDLGKLYQEEWNPDSAIHHLERANSLITIIDSSFYDIKLNILISLLEVCKKQNIVDRIPQIKSEIQEINDRKADTMEEKNTVL